MGYNHHVARMTNHVKTTTFNLFLVMLTISSFRRRYSSVLAAGQLCFQQGNRSNRCLAPYSSLQPSTTRHQLATGRWPRTDIRLKYNLHSSSKDSIVLGEVTLLRKELLHNCLESLDLDADMISQAALQSIENPTQGYDGRFGKSAIKAYRSFIYPKSQEQELDSVHLQAAARRTSHQIQFLLARHKSHLASWVRHHDSDQLARKSGATFPIMVLLDNVRSAHNVGSIFRSADATSVEQIVTCGITPHPNGSGAEKLQKSALGADSIVDSCHFETTKQGIEYVRTVQPEYIIVGMETTEQSVSYTEYDFTPVKGVCLVLGNEVTGVDADLMSMMDIVVEIPMFGVKNSLNIAACAPVVLYEIIRQWKTDGRII